MKHLLLATCLLTFFGCKSEADKKREAAELASIMTQLKRDAEDDKHKISLETYALIQLGMAQSEAEKIMYKPGVEVSSSQIGASRTELYTWDFGPRGTVALMFQNGRLISKSQHGLY
ncbi:MAG: hypothetical protein ACRYFZ_21765 [Janthinobacterium lividum]